MAHGGRRRWVYLGLRLVGTALAISWVLHKVDPGRAWSALVAAPGWVYLVPPAGVLLNTLVQAFRVRCMLGAMGAQLSMGRVLSALCRGAFLGLALPSGGQEVAKAAFLVRASRRLDAGIGALLAARVLQLPTWALLLSWTLAMGLMGTDPVLGMAASGFLAVTAVVLGVCLWGLRRPEAPRLPLPGWTPDRVRGVLQRIVDALRSLRATPGVMIVVALLALPCVTVNILVVWAVLQGFGAPLQVDEVAALLPAADVLIWMPVTIGGLGVREGLFVHFLAPRGVAVGTAVAVGLTRWTGELTRALVGGLLFVLGDTVGEGIGADGPRRLGDG